MILSTLPDIPGRTYDVIGVVFGWPSSGGKGFRVITYETFDSDTQAMFGILVERASRMGADAIVDIKIPTTSWPLFVIGTAVKLR
jgi:uncharacterized protein YbjQ (UPF0145 family)